MEATKNGSPSAIVFDVFVPSTQIYPFFWRCQPCRSYRNWPMWRSFRWRKRGTSRMWLIQRPAPLLFLGLFKATSRHWKLGYIFSQHFFWGDVKKHGSLWWRFLPQINPAHQNVPQKIEGKEMMTLMVVSAWFQPFFGIFTPNVLKIVPILTFFFSWVAQAPANITLLLRRHESLLEILRPLLWQPFLNLSVAFQSYPTLSKFSLHNLLIYDLTRKKGSTPLRSNLIGTWRPYMVCVRVVVPGINTGNVNGATISNYRSLNTSRVGGPPMVPNGVLQHLYIYDICKLYQLIICAFLFGVTVNFRARWPPDKTKKYMAMFIVIELPTEPSQIVTYQVNPSKRMQQTILASKL